MSNNHPEFYRTTYEYQSNPLNQKYSPYSPLEEKGTKDIENGVVKSTKDYLNEFNRYGVSQTSSDIPVKIKNYLKAGNKFTELEMTLLMDLAPTTPEEAFYLIPSLKTKLTEDEMNEYLSKLNKEIINNS